MTFEAADKAAETPSLTTGECRQNPRGTEDQCADVTVKREISHEEPMDLLSAVLERPNMQRAYDRVMRNKGAPGVDGLTVAELKGYLKAHWPRHKQELMDGTYQPQPVRTVEIPKPGGGVRQLGIPTVLGTEPYARWCGRTAGAIPPPTRYNKSVWL